MGLMAGWTRCLFLCVVMLVLPAITTAQPNQDTIQRIEELEQWIREHPGVFDGNVHNELRHLYSIKNPPDLRKSMEHSNVILQHSVMDEYILNILSGWQIDTDTAAARANLLVTATFVLPLLMSEESYPDLRFIAAACFLKIGDLYTAEGNLEEATSFYLKVTEDTSPDMAQYRVLAEKKLGGIKEQPAPIPPVAKPVPTPTPRPQEAVRERQEVASQHPTRAMNPTQAPPTPPVPEPVPTPIPRPQEVERPQQEAASQRAIQSAVSRCTGGQIEKMINAGFSKEEIVRLCETTIESPAKGTLSKEKGLKEQPSPTPPVASPVPTPTPPVREAQHAQQEAGSQQVVLPAHPEMLGRFHWLRTPQNCLIWAPTPPDDALTIPNTNPESIILRSPSDVQQIEACKENKAYGLAHISSSPFVGNYFYDGFRVASQKHCFDEIVAYKPRLHAAPDKWLPLIYVGSMSQTDRELVSKFGEGTTIWIQTGNEEHSAQLCSDSTAQYYGGMSLFEANAVFVLVPNTSQLENISVAIAERLAAAATQLVEEESRKRTHTVKTGIGGVALGTEQRTDLGLKSLNRVYISGNDSPDIYATVTVDVRDMKVVPGATRIQVQEVKAAERARKLEVERRAQIKERINNFYQKAGSTELVEAETLQSNPFRYEGDYIIVLATYLMILDKNTSVFETRSGILAVSGLDPKHSMSQGAEVLLGGTVTGTTQVPTPMRGSITAPFLSLRDIYVCQINNCAEREAYKATPTPPVPTPVPTPTPPPSKSTKVRSIEEVNFLTSTLSLSEDCMQKTVSLRNGEFKDEEIRVRLMRGILYADLTGDSIDEAIVPLVCDTYGNFYIIEILSYTLRDGEPVLFARLPQSIIERDYKKFYPEGFAFEIRKVQATDGKLIIHRGVDGSHACPENDALFEYTWNGENFVLAGRPIKSPLRNCGVQEEQATQTPPVPEPVPTPTPPQAQQPSEISELQLFTTLLSEMVNYVLAADFTEQGHRLANQGICGFTIAYLTTQGRTITPTIANFCRYAQQKAEEPIPTTPAQEEILNRVKKLLQETSQK